MPAPPAVAVVVRACENSRITCCGWTDVTVTDVRAKPSASVNPTGGVDTTPTVSVGGCRCDDVTASLCRGATCEVVTACDAPGRPLARGGEGGITLSSDDDVEEPAGGGWCLPGVLG